MKKHRKTVWNKSMGYRKRAYFSFMNSGKRYSDSVEWYTWTDLDYLAKQGDKLVWEDIYFPSKRYKKICYVALLQTVDLTAEDKLEEVLHDLTAQYLGFEDYGEFCRDMGKSRAERKKEFRVLAKYDKKNNCYHIDPRLFSPSIFPDFGFMSFNEIMYTQIWPKAREEIGALLPSIYSNMKLKIGKKRFVITQTLNVHDLTIANIDRYVQDFLDSREHIIKAKDETTLCHPDLDIVRESVDEYAKSYTPTEEDIAKRREYFEQSEKETIS